ncbi:MAG: hypothetical protein SH850_00780, partial [Planctomycetaceae bacterium]|nr:hypothetical protein [Planctomycetaceae bacterium]
MTLNHITSDGTYDYEYDAEGNRVLKTEIAIGDYIVYSWDHRNRLTGVEFHDDEDALLKSVHYTYDVFDRLIVKEVDDDGDSAIDRGQSFVYDGADVILIYDEAGALTDRFLRGPQTDQVFADEQATETVWYLADQQGTIRDVAEYDSGTETTSVVNHLQYDSFGRITPPADTLPVPTTPTDLLPVFRTVGRLILERTRRGDRCRSEESWKV